MIVIEFYRTREDGVNLYKIYSDKGKYIKKSGTDEIYEEAIDIEGKNYEYEETSRVIPRILEENEVSENNDDLEEDTNAL